MFGLLASVLTIAERLCYRNRSRKNEIVFFFHKNKQLNIHFSTINSISENRSIERNLCLGGFRIRAHDFFQDLCESKCLKVLLLLEEFRFQEMETY